MATKEELEQKVKSLEKALSDAEGAIRKFSQVESNLLGMISKISTELSTLKVDVANLKVALTKVTQKSSANVTRYE